MVNIVAFSIAIGIALFNIVVNARLIEIKFIIVKANIIIIKLAWCVCVNSSKSFKNPCKNIPRLTPNIIRTVAFKKRLLNTISGLIRKSAPAINIIVRSTRM